MIKQELLHTTAQLNQDFLREPEQPLAWGLSQLSLWKVLRGFKNISRGALGDNGH